MECGRSAVIRKRPIQPWFMDSAVLDLTVSRSLCFTATLLCCKSSSGICLLRTSCDIKPCRPCSPSDLVLGSSRIYLKRQIWTASALLATITRVKERLLFLVQFCLFRLASHRVRLVRSHDVMALALPPFIALASHHQPVSCFIIFLTLASIFLYIGLLCPLEACFVS